MFGASIGIDGLIVADRKAEIQQRPASELALALDAHVAHPGPFTAEDLLPYRTAREPACQREALYRRKIMMLWRVA